MARTESRTKTSIWANEEFRKLTGRAQRLYWVIYSQPTINLCGVVALTIRKWAGTAADETSDTVEAALSELEDNQFLIVDYDHEEVLVRTFIRHDGVARSPKTLSAARAQAAGISSAAIRTAVDNEFQRIADTPPDTPPDGVCDTQPDRAYNGSEHPGNTLGDTPSDTQPDRPRGRARAVSVPSLRPQSPTPSPSPDPIAGQNRDEVLRTNGTGTKPTALARRLAEACDARTPAVAAIEAAGVTAWALRYVDQALLEEAIGWAEALEPSRRLKLPRGVTATIQAKARDRGIAMPDYDVRLIGAVA